MTLQLGRAGRLVRAIGLVVILAGLLLAGCRTSAESGGGAITSTGAEIAPEPSVEQSVHPPLSSTPTQPIEESSPAAAVPGTMAPPPSPTSIQTSTPRGTPEPITTSESNGSSPTDTPAPTFTPPPPPPVPTGQQLWLQRPVPASGPTWTDKSYPYGSTRGGTLRPHTGVEFIVPTGTPILAAAAGTVLVAGDDATVAHGPQTNFYGNLVIVEHDTSDGSALFTLYGHLSEVQVEVGQRVAAGDTLGLSGESGVADGPHLHFEVRVGVNRYVATRNPLLWLRPQYGMGVVAGRVTNPAGELLYQAPITLIRTDAPAPYTATTSYAQSEPNSDDIMRENFALDDVVPGFYEVVVDAGGKRFTTELWVYADRVNWVELTVGP